MTSIACGEKPKNSTGSNFSVSPKGESHGRDSQNRIKETQLDLFGTRASCHTFLANWLRLLFAVLAYTLMHQLPTIALTRTDLARAQAATIRTKLLKIGASVIRNTRRIRILLEQLSLNWIHIQRV
jgi:hypothetical protein